MYTLLWFDTFSGIFAATNTCSRSLGATTEVRQVASRNYPSSYRFVDTLCNFLVVLFEITNAGFKKIQKILCTYV